MSCQTVSRQRRYPARSVRLFQPLGVALVTTLFIAVTLTACASTTSAGNPKAASSKATAPGGRTGRVQEASDSVACSLLTQARATALLGARAVRAIDSSEQPMTGAAKCVYEAAIPGNASTPKVIGYVGATLLMYDTRVTTPARAAEALRRAVCPQPTTANTVTSVPAVAPGAQECSRRESDGTLSSDTVAWQSGDYFYDLSDTPGYDSFYQTMAVPTGVVVAVAKQIAAGQ